MGVSTKLNIIWRANYSQLIFFWKGHVECGSNEMENIEGLYWYVIGVNIVDNCCHDNRGSTTLVLYLSSMDLNTSSLICTTNIILTLRRQNVIIVMYNKFTVRIWGRIATHIGWMMCIWYIELILMWDNVEYIKIASKTPYVHSDGLESRWISNFFR